ncbi:MAG: hypothetical protein RBS39_07500 [Phycisphaerales bacterium]|nr:hypothetical protein [Phycisphaerales bacterium]
MRWLGTSAPGKPGIGRGHNLTFKLGNSAVTRWTGQYVVDMSNPDGPLASQYVGQFNVFCIELSQELSSSTRRYNVGAVNTIPLLGAGDFLSLMRAGAVRDIFADFGGDALSSSASDDLAAAFAIALWEIVYDYNPAQPQQNLNLFGGTFTFVHPDSLSDSVEAIVNNIFNSIGQNLNPPIAGFSNLNHQDFVTCQDGGCTIVPLPTTAGLGGLGLLLAGTRRRRR